MTEVSRDQVEALLSEVQDRYLEQDIISAKSVKDIGIDGGKVSVRIVLGYPAVGYHDELKSDVLAKLEAGGITGANVVIETNIVAHSVQKTVKRQDGIKNIVAVASGKGGVGK
ncbi:MAG: Iron-sulfur cluster carrier protein, partial [uncultured Thiotrichaceae bacterium]